MNGAGSLRLSRNYRAIDYAPGIVILAGIVKIMPALNQSDDRNLPMRYINFFINIFCQFVDYRNYISHVFVIF